MALLGHPLAQLPLLPRGRGLEAALHGPGGRFGRHVARLRGVEEVGAHEAAAMEELLYGGHSGYTESVYKDYIDIKPLYIYHYHIISSYILYQNMLCYIICCCIVLYCIVLYCIVLYCIVLYCIVLYCIVFYCIVNILCIL